MNLRNFLKLLRAEWRAGSDDYLLERAARVGVYPSSLGAVARRDPAAAEGDARLGGEIRRSSPQAASYPRPGVPAACLYSREGRPCRLLPDLGRELWCPACLAYSGGERR